MAEAEVMYECSVCPEGEHTLMHWNSLGMVCGRCGEHTGNNHQGHWWSFCQVRAKQVDDWKDALRGMHFCCPGNCELEEQDG